MVTPYSGYNASALYSLYTQFSTNYDGHEPNDNLIFARPITAGDYEYSATLDNQYDQDWFKVNATSGQPLVVDVYRLPNDYDVALYDPSGKLVAYSILGDAVAEHIVYNASSSGDHYIRVWAWTWASDTATYKLRVNKKEIKMFSRPVGEFVPISAFFDLDPASGSIRDWTGWTGTSWVYGHAYDGHTGTDYAGVAGDNVYACKAGTVIEVVQDERNTYPDGPRTYGTYVTISHGNNYFTVYGHLKYQSTLVAVNDNVSDNQRIALMDNTGYSTGDHLHLTVQIGGVRICPYDNGLIHYGGAKDENR